MDDRSKYIVQVAGARTASGNKPSASPVYRHAMALDGFPTLESSTLYELFSRSVEKYAGNACLGVRVTQADGSVGPYVFKTYAEVGEEVADLGSGLKALGIKPGARVGVFGTNSPQVRISCCPALPCSSQWGVCMR